MKISSIGKFDKETEQDIMLRVENYKNKKGTTSFALYLPDVIDEFLKTHKDGRTWWIRRAVYNLLDILPPLKFYPAKSELFRAAAIKQYIEEKDIKQEDFIMSEKDGKLRINYGTRKEPEMREFKVLRVMH